MSVNERQLFINFPNCTKDEELQNHLAHWQRLRLAYGNGLPGEHLRQMFRDVLPEHVLNELRKQHLDTTQKEYNWVSAELGRLNDYRLSKWNMSKLAQQLKPKTSTSVNQIGSKEPSPPIEPPASPVPDWANFQANMERMIAAAMAKNDRG